MKKINLKEVESYVNDNIETFHDNKIKALKKQNLKKLLKSKNPYLFKAKNINVASDFVKEMLDAKISASEEKIFGAFLEDLAIYISHQACGGRKSSATGLDLEFNYSAVHYVVSIKSGPNWGNSSQQNKLNADFKKAKVVLRQNNHTLNVHAILGICYGKTKTNVWKGGTALKVVGQNFWYFLSQNKELYKEIIEPLGYESKKHNDAFYEKKATLLNLFTQEFMEDFCDSGIIDWNKVVEFNSGNFDLAEFYSK